MSDTRWMPSPQYAATEPAYRAHAHNLTVSMAIYCREVTEARWWQFARRAQSLRDMRARFTASKGILDMVLAGNAENAGGEK